jgi:hypothetical protein
MNIDWSNLTALQRKALMLLCQHGHCPLPDELGEQLCNLGLAERLGEQSYCVSALGATVLPATVH